MFGSRLGIDPGIRHGKPVIKGTKVPVGVILGSLAECMSVKEIAEEYGTRKEDLRAAIEDMRLETQ